MSIAETCKRFCQVPSPRGVPSILGLEGSWARERAMCGVQHCANGRRDALFKGGEMAGTVGKNCLQHILGMRHIQSFSITYPYNTINDRNP
jgi:hypothetical protein